MDFKKPRRRLYIAALIIALVAFGCFSETLSLGQRIYDAAPKIFIWNSTYSVPKGLYLIVPMENLANGDYVLFVGTNDLRSFAIERGWIEENTMFLKKIGGLPGDVYRVDPKTKMFYVNDEYKGMVSDLDSKGRLLPHEIQGTKTVEESTFLPVGDSPKSFDGRYYGTQPLSSIKKKVIPVFTFQ